MPNSGGGPKRSIFDEEDHGNVQHKNDGQQQNVKNVESIKSSQQPKQGYV